MVTMHSKTEMILMVLLKLTLVFSCSLKDSSHNPYDDLMRQIQIWESKLRLEPVGDIPVKEPGQESRIDDTPDLEPSKTAEEILDIPEEEPGQEPPQNKNVNDIPNLEPSKTAEETLDFPEEEPGQEPPQNKDVADIPNLEPSKTVKTISYIDDELGIPVEQSEQKHQEPTVFQTEEQFWAALTDKTDEKLRKQSSDSGQVTNYDVELIRFCVLVASVLFLLV